MPEINSIAKMILLGLLPLDVVANSFQFAEEQRNHFVAEMGPLIRQCLVDYDAMDIHASHLSGQLQQYQQRSSVLKSRANEEESAAAALVTNHSQSEELELPITPGAQLAFTLISFLKDPVKRSNPDSWLSLSTNTLAGTHSILKNTALLGLSTVSSSGIAAGVNAGVSLIREYQYQRREGKRKEELNNTIAEAEKSYLVLHQMYDIVATHYQTALAEVENTQGAKSTQYRQTMNEWLMAEQYFEEQVKQQQQNIATTSAFSQQAQSKRRIDRVVDGISTVVSMAHFSGPPGMIASTLIKGFASLGTMVGHSMAEQSAHFNHSLTSATKVLLITDTESLEKAQEQLSHSVNPAVALSGPTLGVRFIKGISVDRIIYTDSALAEQLTADVGGRCSCSFSLSKAIPEIPTVDPIEKGQSYTNNPDLKKGGKDKLKALVEAQKALTSEQDFLYALGSKMMQKHKPWPYVVNYAELSKSLVDAHEAIKKTKEEVREQMGRDYSSNRNSEGMRLLAELGTFEKKFETNLKYMRTVGEELENTPHRCLFVNERQSAIRIYTGSTKAREMLLTDIEFKTNAIEQLINHCEKLGKGRHITNMGEAINELQTQLDILEKSALNSDESHHDDWIRLSACREKLDIVTNKGAYLDKLRIEYVTASKAQEHTRRAQYQELSSLQGSLLSYGDNLPDIHLNLTTQSLRQARKAGTSIFQQVNSIQQEMLGSLKEDLEEATPIDRSQLSKTDAIVSPNRVYFGFSKHEDMEQEIKEKLTQLTKDPLIDTLQVMPLRAIDEDIIASCQGRLDLLTKVIEGLKTEIQWLNKFQDACELNRISIANMAKLSVYYERQLQILTTTCEHRTEVLGSIQKAGSSTKSSLVEMKSRLHNVIHEHDPEIELAKAYVALDSVKNYSTKGLLALPEGPDNADTLDSSPSFSESHPDL